jgi:hypothetical protein
MYETKLYCPRGNIFVRGASLQGRLLFRRWRILLAQCERETFIILRLRAKYITQGAEFFPDT